MPYRKNHHLSRAFHHIDYRILHTKQPEPFRRIKVHASRREVIQLVEEGFLVIQDLLSASSVSVMQGALGRVVTAENNDPLRQVEPCLGGRYVRHLLEKDRGFFELFSHEIPLSIARATLGPQVQFDELTARVTDLSDEDAQIPWHIHHRVLLEPMPPLFAYPHGINCLFYLDKVDESSGPLCVLPGSHRSNTTHFKEADTTPKEGEISLPVDAGTAILIHANLWHRSLPARKRAGLRRVIIAGYLPSWLKTEEAAKNVPPPRRQRRLQRHQDAEVRELAGVFRWG